MSHTDRRFRVLAQKRDRILNSSSTVYTANCAVCSFMRKWKGIVSSGFNYHTHANWMWMNISKLVMDDYNNNNHRITANRLLKLYYTLVLETRDILHTSQTIRRPRDILLDFNCNSKPAILFYFFAVVVVVVVVLPFVWICNQNNRCSTQTSKNLISTDKNFVERCTWYF